MFTKFIGALFGLSVIAGSLPAQDHDFGGKTIDLIVPFGPGGGSSVHARLIAGLLEEELPGEPTIVIRNIDGAGSVRGLNRFARYAAPDGLTLAAVGASSYLSYVLEDPTVEFPLAQFIPILASPSGFLAYGRADFELTGDPEHDLKHLQENMPTLAVDDPTSTDMMLLYCYDLLDIKVRAVWGVSGGEARQAFLRGETVINHDNIAMLESELEPMRKEGILVPLFTMGLRDENGEFGRDPNVPDTPSCPELYQIAHDRPLSGIEYDVYAAMYEVRMSVAKALVLPPDTPDRIVRTYHEAMARVLDRPELQDASARLVLGGYPQFTGEAAMRAHKSAVEISEPTKEALRAWLNDMLGVHL